MKGRKAERFSSSSYPFLLKTIVVAVLYVSIAFFSFADNGDKKNSPEGLKTERLSFIIPRELVDSYFPYSKGYAIPDTEKVSSYLRRARLYEEKGNIRQASRFYYLAYRRVADEPAAPYIRFKQICLIEDIDAAIKSLNELIDKYPTFPLINAVRFELALDLYLKKSYDRALKAAEAIIENENEGTQIFSPFVYIFTGTIRNTQKQYEKAIDDFMSSLTILSSLDCSEYEAQVMSDYIGIAGAYTGLKRFDEAKLILKKVFGSTSIPAIRELSLYMAAVMYGENGETEKASVLYNRIINDYPSTVYALKAQRALGTLETGSSPASEVSPGTGKFFIGQKDESLLKARYLVSTDENDSQKSGKEDAVTGSGSVTGFRYAVQVGSFKKEENAKKLADELGKKGFSAVLSSGSLNGGSVFRVRVGYYDTRDEAEEVLVSLKKSGIKGFVVREGQ